MASGADLGVTAGSAAGVRGAGARSGGRLLLTGPTMAGPTTVTAPTDIGSGWAHAVSARPASAHAITASAHQRRCRITAPILSSSRRGDQAWIARSDREVERPPTRTDPPRGIDRRHRRRTARVLPKRPWRRTVSDR